MIDLQERPVAGVQTGLSEADRAEIQGLLGLKLRQPAVEPSVDDVASDAQTRRFQPTSPWRLASTNRVRIAEDVVVLAIMGYFAVGLAKVFGIL
jgi:hypothetical protein